MRDYELHAVDRLFNRNQDQLKKNVNKLIHNMGYYSGDPLEIWQEACMLFYKHFAGYYEDDRQYLSFLFICMKNKIRNFQRRDIVNEKKHCTSLSAIRHGCGIQTSNEQNASGDEFNATWGQVKDPHCDWQNGEIEELVTNAKRSMDMHQEAMFTIIVEEGKFVKEIAEIYKLRNLTMPTPPQKSRLTVLEKRPGPLGFNLRDTVNYIQESLKPLLESNTGLDGLRMPFTTVSV